MMFYTEQTTHQARTSFALGITPATWTSPREERTLDAVYRYIKTHPRKSIQEAADYFGCWPQTMRKQMNQLVASGFVVNVNGHCVGSPKHEAIFEVTK